MASPGCRRWQHKGRTSTNPALNRYGRSRSALYRADLDLYGKHWFSVHLTRYSTEVDFSSCDVRLGSNPEVRRDARNVGYLGYTGRKSCGSGHRSPNVAYWGKSGRQSELPELRFIAKGRRAGIFVFLNLLFSSPIFSRRPRSGG